MINEKKIAVLLIEDNLGEASLLQSSFKHSEINLFDIFHVSSMKEAEDYFLSKTCDIVLLDLGLSGSTGINALIGVQNFLSFIPIIVLIGLSDEESGMKAMQLGAQDYLVKGNVTDVILSKAILNAIKRTEINREQALSLSVLEHINNAQNLKDSIQEILKELKAYTGFSSVRMLLKNNENTNPYYQKYDFDDEQITQYNFVNIDNDEKPYSSQIPSLSLCDLVLSKKISKYAKNSTVQGSFWSNNFASFIDNYECGDTELNFDSSSVINEYNSLALIPLVSGEKTIGLLQLADISNNKLSLSCIQFFEEVASSIGIALHQKSNYNEIKDNDLKLRTIYDSVYIGIIVEDIDTERIIFANTRAREIIGKSEEMILGKSSSAFFQDDSSASQDDTDSEACIPFESYLQIDEEQIHVLRGTKIVNINGRYFRIESFSDLTEKDNSQEKIIKLSRFPNENPYPVLRVSITGDILYHNKAGEDLLPYICDTGNSKLNSAFLLLVKNCFEFGELRSQEVNCEKTLYSIFLRPIIEEQYVNIYGVDITAQRRIEKQLRHSEKMQAIGQLAGGIAHEFNNQLAVINGFSELVLNFPPVHDSLKYSKMVVEVINAGERAADLTSQLLTYCRHKDISLDIVNVNEVITDMQVMLKRILGEDICLSTKLISNPLLIEIDKGQLCDVLVNLCANARDAMKHGGEICIITENGCWNDETVENDNIVLSGSYVSVKVSDTGQGMDEETIKRIYEPFFTTKPIGKGTGLGLAMVYGVVKERCGTINVTSEINKGTCFNICFPATLKQSEINVEIVTAKEEYFLADSETILVVEDESGVLLYVTAVLQDAGYTVLQSNNPVEAIKIFEENINSISLILSDVIMPEISGFELIKTLKEKKPNVNAICMSGYSYDMLNQRTRVKDDIYIIKKPIRPSDLLSAIKSVLKK